MFSIAHSAQQLISTPRRAAVYTLILLTLVVFVHANKAEHADKHLDQDINEQLKSCPAVQVLNQRKAAASASSSATSSSFIPRLFKLLFPGSPAVNSLLATLYISGPPNLLLGLCPPDIDASSLSVMVAFAVGGLLGDTIFHLLPEIFLGEDAQDEVRFVMLEPNRNLLLGAAIIVGFVTFVAMDKALRIATGGKGGHDHHHGADREKQKWRGEGKAAATGSDAKNEKALRSRKNGKSDSMTSTTSSVDSNKEVNTSIKMGGYLNLIADFTHNITDGLALSTSFYASPTLGATTTVAVFFHEIPHEVGDFALLIQSGFSKRAAMGAQFVTALGAFIGTLIGIAIQESSGGQDATEGSGGATGLFDTDLQWGDMLLPFTAGTFLYVGTVAVIPELLETGPEKLQELKTTLMQFVALAAGAGIMLAISWS